MTDLEALSALNSSINNLTTVTGSMAQQKQQQKNNKELLEMEQEWQLKLWQLAQEYNRPINEVARLLEAGINPALQFSNAGASAAPVPNSPQAQAGVTTVGPLSNPALAATQVRAAESQIELNEATADRQEAEADAARANAGLTDTRNRFETMRADVFEENKAILATLPRIDQALKYIMLHLAGNKRTRDDIYTSTFGAENDYRVERLRLNNRVLEADYERIQRLTDLYVAQGRLTDAQARNVRLQGDILFTERYIAQWNYNMQRIFNKNIYGSSDSPSESSAAVQEAIATARQEILNNVASSVLRGKSIANDYRFEIDYGLGARFYTGFEGPRRSANATRAGIYYGFLSAVSGAATAAITAGATKSLIKYRGAMTDAINRTNRDFGIRSRFMDYNSYLDGGEFSF